MLLATAVHSVSPRNIRVKQTPNVEADFCKYLPDGFYEYPYDCAAYISCIDSKANLQYCSSGKLFNNDLQICDTPDSVDCSAKPIPDPECLNVPNGAVFPLIEHCNAFMVCIDQQAVLQTCPDHYLFNPVILVCDDPNEVVCYSDHTTTPLTTTQIPKTTTEVYTKCVGEKPGTTFPYIEDCQQYILCLGDDQYYKANCPVNAWYDPKTGDCGRDVSKTACQEVETTTTAATTTTQIPQDRCVDQELGVSYPLATDCTKYILCLGDGESMIVDCIYNAWFDPTTGNCEQNVSPTACQESVSTTTTTATTTAETTTLKPSTTTDQPDPQICAGVPNGQYVNYPDNCRKYIICVEPVPIAFHCTKGYFFSAALQQCVDWAESDCDSIGTTAAPLPPTPAPDTCINGEGNTYPFTENCQWFVRCINDKVYMMGVCGIGEYYDPISGECGGTVAPDACLQSYNPITTTTTALPESTTKITTTTTPTLQPDPSDPCAGVEDGVLVPYPNDCTKFIQCYYQNPLILNCAEGQEFSPLLKRCMAAWYANCTMTATTTRPFTTTTKLPVTTTTESNQSPNDICVGKPEGSLVPYPHNCSKYIVCQEPIAVGYDCPAELEFNVIMMTCTDAQLANCIP